MRKIAGRKEDLPPLREGYVRLVHLTKNDEAIPEIERNGLSYRRHGILSSTARWWADPNKVDYSGKGDPRFSGAGTTAIVMDLPEEEARTHERIVYGKGNESPAGARNRPGNPPKSVPPGVVPSKYIVGIFDVSEEGKLEKKLLGIFSVIGIAIAIIFLSSNITSFAIINITKGTSNTIGIIGFIVGMISLFLYLK